MPPPSGRKHFLSIWPRGLFTQNSIKTSNEREFEKFLSVTQTISHPGLSQGVLPRSAWSRGQREEPFWPKVYKELSVAFKQTPPLIGSICLCFSGSLLGEQIRSGNFERMLIIEWFRMPTQQALQTGDHSQGCVFSELNQQPTMKSLTRCDFFFFLMQTLFFLDNTTKRLNQLCFNKLTGITKWDVSSPSLASFLRPPPGSRLSSKTSPPGQTLLSSSTMASSRQTSSKSRSFSNKCWPRPGYCFAHLITRACPMVVVVCGQTCLLLLSCLFSVLQISSSQPHKQGVLWRGSWYFCKILCLHQEQPK